MTVVISQISSGSPMDTPGDDADVFSGNWVYLVADFDMPCLKNGAGLYCGASSLPVPPGLQTKIEDWGGKCPWRHAGGSTRVNSTDAITGKNYDEEGFELACQLSGLLPHWVVEYSSGSGTYRTPDNQDTGIVTTDGRFVDPTEEQRLLRRRLFEEENGTST